MEKAAGALRHRRLPYSGPFRCRLRLFRREHHQHLAAFHAWMLLDLGGLGNIFLDALQEIHAELAVGELAAAEAQRHLHLVAFLDEGEHLLHLGVVIVVVDVGTHLDLLDLLRLLRLPREVGLFWASYLYLPTSRNLATGGSALG